MQYVQYKLSCLILLLSRYVFFLLLIVSSWLHANTLQIQSSISIDRVEGYGVVLDGITVTFDTWKSRSIYQIHIKSALLPENKGRIKNIALVCQEGTVSEQEFSCAKGDLSFEDSLASANTAPITFYRKKNGNLSLQIQSIQLAEGHASIDVEIQQGKWRANVNSYNLSLSKLQTVLPDLPQLSLTGNIKSELTLIGNQSNILAINGEAVIRELTFTNEESTFVGEGVTAKITFESKHTNRIWDNDFSTTIFSGELYIDPVFIDANIAPKDVFGRLKWAIDTDQIELAPLHFEDQQAVHLIINTSIDYKQNKTITPIQLNVEYAAFPETYETYLQPFLLDSNLADLQTNGSLVGSIVIDDTIVTQANLKLERLSVEDKQKRFALTKLDGEIGWGNRYSDREYAISFNSANIYKLRLGQSSFSFYNQGESLVLNQAASVPILDGAINIESFLVNHPGTKDQSISLDISLTPVSMKKVSSIFGWPEMSGNLAGYAPSVRYKQGSVDVQGALLIRAFEGTTTIHNLKAKDLFSITPKFFADIQIDNLDLSTLTETFSFGEITGKLDGYINNLQFVSWQPTQFDAWLGTPDGDKSRHMISQTAVDNLTQVGNGVSNIFSKSFLRFLDNFRYDRLGIGCRLKNATCNMRGVHDSDKGFYIVKGSGLPRIDIIGFTDEVSWPVLTARLKRVVATQELIVQ